MDGTVSPTRNVDSATPESITVRDRRATNRTCPMPASTSSSSRTFWYRFKSRDCQSAVRKPAAPGGAPHRVTTHSHAVNAIASQNGGS